MKLSHSKEKLPPATHPGTHPHTRAHTHARTHTPTYPCTVQNITAPCSAMVRSGLGNSWGSWGEVGCPRGQRRAGTASCARGQHQAVCACACARAMALIIPGGGGEERMDHHRTSRVGGRGTWGSALAGSCQLIWRQASNVHLVAPP